MDVRTAGLRLRDALMRRDLAEVREILRAEPRAADWQDEHGLAALHVAGRPEFINALLDAGADINIVDRRGFTPLHLIQIGGGREASQALLARGARVNVACPDGCTALHSAAAFLREDAVELLLANGADPGARNKYGYTPAHYALKDGNERNARLLWDRAGIRDVFLAAGLGEVEYLADLLVKDPAQSQAADGRLLTPLHWAAGSGKPQSVRLLLWHSPDINARDDCDRTPLHWAARYGHPEVVRLLLKHSPDVNARDDRGRTPLHWAAIGIPIKENAKWAPRSFDVAKLLIEQGAEISAESNDGKTPLTLLLSHPQLSKPALAKLLGEQNDP